METNPFFQIVAATFAELGVGDAVVSRTLLLKDRHFVGYCFRCGDFHAIWKPDDTEVRFFGAGGQLLRAVSLPNQEKRNAA